MTDAEWELLRPEAEAVMAELRRSPAGRPMEHDLRRCWTRWLRDPLWRRVASAAELPTGGSIDSQSVKAADTVGAASRVYDAGKRINGRKRLVVADSLGLLLTVIVTATSVQDRAMGRFGCWPCCVNASPRSV